MGWPTRMRALDDPADGQAAQVVGGIEVRDEGLQRCRRIAVGRRDVGEHRVEQGRQVRVLRRDPDADDGAAFPGHRRQHWELELVRMRGQVDEELLDVGEDLVRAGVVAIELVEHDHRG